MRKRAEIQKKIHKLRQDKACIRTTGRTIKDIVDSAYIAGTIDALKWSLQKPGDPDNCIPPEAEEPEEELKVHMHEEVLVEEPESPTSERLPPDPVVPPAPPGLRIVLADDEKGT